ncbi:MAG: restriction endonuclease subunit S [Clostridiaceae bacterium]|nr:restriction endonuclease subunit S [Clostridiaceae bacterium]
MNYEIMTNSCDTYIEFKNGKKRPLSQGKIPVYGGNGILDYCDDWNNDGNTVIIGRVGAYCGSIYYSSGKCWVSDNAIAAKANDNADPKFIYYALLSANLNNLRIGSSQPLLTQEILRQLQLAFPSLSSQQAIARILSSFDDKIELNNRVNKTLEEIAQTLFKRWFVDFEFPDENGNPYKSSGGKMIESELGMIPEGWIASSLSFIILNFDSKRVPLSSREREKLEKIYPYYGAASQLDFVDNYLFDGIYVLMGEDGTVIMDNGTPMLQYVWGKFWVNNHAHILQGKAFISTEYVYLLLRQTNIVHIVTGAVQPKITQKNMNELPAVLPSAEVAKHFRQQTTNLFGLLRSSSDEIKKLAQIRDTLLPKLMSGEIRIPFTEE